MAIEKVKAFFRQAGLESRVQELSVSSATVDLAAQALGCAPCRIAKSLSFLVDGGPILVVAAGDARVDNAKFKARFQTKAKMLSPEDTKALVGHAVGGVCPFAVNEGVKVYLHIIFDGRSTPPGSAPQLLAELEEQLQALGRGEVVDGVGRGIALDRDGNYAKIEKAYNCMVKGEGAQYR